MMHDQSVNQQTAYENNLNKGKLQQVWNPNQPTNNNTQPDNSTGDDKYFDDFENEPPLLEELGIEPEKILKKYLAVLSQRNFQEVCVYEDMFGSILVMFIFGALLLLVSFFPFFKILNPITFQIS